MHTNLALELVKARQAELALARVPHELPAGPRRPLRVRALGRRQRCGCIAPA